MQLYLLLQVGCENFSVYKQNTRTTSAVEAYNGVLGRSIEKNGNFFKFINVIRNEEFFKSRHFFMSVEGGGSLQKQRKKASAQKDKYIEETSALLESGKINVATFLSRMIFEGHGICVNMVPSLFDDAEEDDAHVSDNEVGDNEASTSINERECVVCRDNVANVVLLPCKHLKICQTCHSTISSNGVSYNCPYCRISVQDFMQVYV